MALLAFRIVPIPVQISELPPPNPQKGRFTPRVRVEGLRRYRFLCSVVQGLVDRLGVHGFPRVGM